MAGNFCFWLWEMLMEGGPRSRTLWSCCGIRRSSAATIKGVGAVRDDQISARSARVMPVTLGKGERGPRGARDQRARQSGAAWCGVALIHVGYGPAGVASDGDQTHAADGRVAARITRSSLSAPPQCEQTMGVGACASSSVLTALAANPCVI